MSEPVAMAESWPEEIPERPVFTVDAYYDHKSGKFFRRDADGRRYIGATQGSIRRYLKTQGYSAMKGEDELSPLDRALEEIETRQAVDYAAPLAGHPVGVFRSGGAMILVTTGPTLIVPEQGEWPTLSAFLRGLFGEEQFPRLAMHMKVAVEAMRGGVRRPGQALVIAGPRDCGKSLCLTLLSKLLGDRTGKPYAFMTGRTDFNSELFAAECLIIDDEAASLDPRKRREFGARIKTFTVDPEARCHAKHREALTLRPFWRLFIAVNDDPHALQVLPQLEDGLEDKLTLLQARACPMPLDTATDGGWKLLWDTLTGELPAFLYYLMNELVIPAELRCGRYGIKHYHNPELLELMDVTTDELKLLELCDSVLWGDTRDTEWYDTAAALERKLRETARDTTARLLTFTNACGSFLGQLAKKHPERVEKGKLLNGTQRWKLYRPSP
jgi:hypothetical protein